MTFVSMPCYTVEEARRRACIIAFLTFDYCKHVYVKMFSSKMLEDAMFLMKVWKVRDVFGIDINTRFRDAPAKIAKHPHSGLLLDPVEKSYISGNYKKLIFADWTERYYFNMNEKLP